MNDNPRPDKRDLLIGRVLAASVAIESHVVDSLPVMLDKSGLTPGYRDALQAFLQPVVEIMKGLETDVLAYARDSPRPERLVADAIESWGQRLEGYANEFERTAKGPMQQMLAAAFREFTHELTGDRSRAVTPERGKDFDHDR